MTYIKKKQPDGYPVWKLYDDYKPIQLYTSWKDILEKILEYGTLPTVLIYEKASDYNSEYDSFDKITVDELRQLDKRAQSLQKFLDQYENAEAKLDMEKNKESEQEVEKNAQGVVPESQLNVTKQQKSETQLLHDLYQIKQKYKNYGIYIFECVNCTLFMMLHHKVCPHCNKKNIYYDSTLNINQQIESDVNVILEKLQNDLKMKNQALATPKTGGGKKESLEEQGEVENDRSNP